MNRNLTIWVTGASFVIGLPLLFIVLEGATRPERLSAARITETADTPDSEHSTKKLSRDSSAIAIDDFGTGTPQSPQDATGFYEEVDEASPTDQRTWPAQLQSAAEEADSAFTESFISDIGYFGGATDSLRGENLVATVLDPSATSASIPTSTGELGAAASGMPETAVADTSLPSHPICRPRAHECAENADAGPISRGAPVVRARSETERAIGHQGGGVRGPAKL